MCHKMGSRGGHGVGVICFYGEMYGKGACGTNRLRDARLGKVRHVKEIMDLSVKARNAHFYVCR